MNKRNHLNISIFDVQFIIDCDDANLLNYSRYFMSYEKGYEKKGHRLVKLHIKKGKVLANSVISIGKVHASKHKHWNFESLKTSYKPKTFIWKEKGLEIKFCFERNVSELELIVTCDVDAVGIPVIGESIFHLIRSLAYYFRSKVEGIMMHASAIENKNKKGVLFVGNASAGKTTSFLEAILNANAVPVSNDRVLIRAHQGLTHTFSWPSYASFCEGTLLRFDILEEKAYQFEDSKNEYRTIPNNTKLKEDYSKQNKRIYPMGWVSEVCDHQFHYSVVPEKIIFIDVSLHHEFSFKELKTRTKQDLENIFNKTVEFSFLEKEPSFLAWHELEKPKDEFTIKHLKNWIYDGVVFYELKTSPTSLNKNIDSIIN